MSMATSSKISHRVIASLYRVLDWYRRKPGAGKAAVVLNYYSMWRSLHALTVNISKEAWKGIRKLAKDLGIRLPTKGHGWLFLFAVETYLHLFVRAIALSKLGSAPKNLAHMQQSVSSLRNVFAPSVFEWVFDAYSDQQIAPQVGNSFRQDVDLLLQVIYNLNLTTLTVDVFRELYQNILPKSVRRSLGEFYTDEKLVDEVLDSVNLDIDAIVKLYEQYRGASGSREKPVILDPACGSGTFLVRVIRRIFGSLREGYGRCPPDIVDFVEETVVGIDINPFAVEMAKLNILLTIYEEAGKCGMAYTPRNIRVYWADSLSLVKTSQNVLGSKTLVVKIPTLTKVLGSEGEIRVPLLPKVSPEELVSRVHEAVRSGRRLEELRNELEGVAGVDPVRRAESELGNLIEAVRRIEEAGDARVVELVKNASIVASLLGKCSYVVGNPPWVRIHRVAKSVMKLLRGNYDYYKPGSAYDPRFKKTKTPFKEQHDYSLAFVERGLQFLREHGVLGYVITSKVLKAMYAGKMREDILSNHTILELRDYSLHPVPLFQDAVNYPLVLAVKKEKPSEKHQVKVCITNTIGDTMCFSVPQLELPLDQGDKKSPWLIAPLNVIRVFRKIQNNSVRLGDVYEIFMGVKTAADKIFVVKEVVTCSANHAVVLTKGEAKIVVEADLLNPFIEGENIDPFSFFLSNYVIFTHDPFTLEPLWNTVQKNILQRIGVLSNNVEVDCAGRALVYTLVHASCNQISQRIKTLSSTGLRVFPIQPCTVHSCYDIMAGNKRVLTLRLETTGQQQCRIYIEGLEIPGKPFATKHFLDNLSKLIRRDDYRPTMPPWAIFRVSREKFKDHRIAWPAIAKHFEACILPSKAKITVCNTPVDVVVIPETAIYFIVEPDKVKALKLLLYMNSELARSLLKLRAWTAKKGHYVHKSTNVAHLPAPLALLQCNIWKIVEESLSSHGSEDLNEVAKKISTERYEELTRELINALGISEEEYKIIVDYGNWLNELGKAEPEKPESEEEEEEEPEEI